MLAALATAATGLSCAATGIEPNPATTAGESETRAAEAQSSAGRQLIEQLEAVAEGPRAREQVSRFIAAHPRVVVAKAAPYGLALMWVLEFEREEAALALLGQGSATPDAALLLAARGGLDRVVRWLLERGTSVDATNDWGYTALHRAAEYGHTSTVAILLKAGAKPSVKATNDGFTPLHLAVIKRAIEVVKLLLAGQADLEARDSHGSTPLAWGPFAYSPQAVHLYEEIGKPHDTVFEDPGPALAMTLLLDAGAQIESRDNKGSIPLHRAIEIGSRRGAEILLSRGANTRAKNQAGETPRDVAKRQGNREMLDLLVDE